MPKLQKIKRKNLDLEKYSNALNKSLNYRIYAEHWYLDLLTNEKWECWVYGDYEVIMPVPLQFKFGFKFVIQPIYCQQLGVFYKEEIPDELFREFEKKLHKYFVRSYHFNEENTERYNPKGEKRVNYVLGLNRNYDEIFDNYRKDRRKNIKKAKIQTFSLEEKLDLDAFYNLFNAHYSDLFSLIKDTKKLFSELKRKQLLKQFSIIYNGEINNQRLFLVSKNRIIVIASARNKNSKQDFSSYLIDNVVKKYSEKKFLLDFEGSVNPNIAFFMEGFGPEKRYYSKYSNFKFNFRSIKKKLKMN